MSGVAVTSAPTEASSAPWEWLYDLVGIGMWTFVRTRFQVEIIREPLPQIQTGQLWVSTHRAETDVPLVAGMLFARAGMWRHDRPRIHFAARDDLFEPGVVTAGLPLPRPVARASWRLSPGPWLPHVRVHPIRRPTGLKLGQLLRDLPPETRLDDIVGTRLRAMLDERARRLGRPAPVAVADVRHPYFARALWQDVVREDLSPALGDERWHAHIARAANDLRRLVRLVADGTPLLLYPEGRVSPDGSIGNVGELVEIIVRRGRPREIVPVGIAYDPLAGRRTHVAVGIGPALDGAASPSAATLSGELRRATPVTAGQTVCGILACEPGAWDRSRLHAVVEHAVAAAAGAGRPVVGALRGERRFEHVDRVLAALQERQSVTCGADRIVVDATRLMADPMTSRLVREWEATAP
jgi:1-acyl-sn-glycerol-3-phosphate acyltransferase